MESIDNFPFGHLALTCPHLKRLSLDSLNSSNPLTDAEIYGSYLTSYDEIELQAAFENGKLEVLKIDNRSSLAVNEFYEFASSPKSRVTLSQLRTLVTQLPPWRNFFEITTLMSYTLPLTPVTWILQSRRDSASSGLRAIIGNHQNPRTSLGCLSHSLESEDTIISKSSSSFFLVIFRSTLNGQNPQIGHRRSIRS
ncbi:hypothetical protein Hypma_012539 [Hypsizygus marmoreus]|uniref:F-box domain-containing protein n=1 Tax=Hypsizygus marmoreus TaxID=39966 RepID=A0A369JGJ9_HYPMA|nr:hypothetical protein Hypma_012539 [Hypsizygus marmoreus]